MISYEPFWQTLKLRKLSTYALITKYNISSATIDRMKKGNGISTMKIDDLCRILKCKVEDIIEYVNDKDEIKTSIKAKEYIKDIINANSRKFDDNNYNEVWGRFKEVNPDYKICYINAQILFRELQRGGYEFETVKKEWSDMNFLLKNTVGRYIHQTTINCEKGNYIALDLHY